MRLNRRVVVVEKAIKKFKSKERELELEITPARKHLLRAALEEEKRGGCREEENNNTKTTDRC